MEWKLLCLLPFLIIAGKNKNAWFSFKDLYVLVLLTRLCGWVLPYITGNVQQDVRKQFPSYHVRECIAAVASLFGSGEGRKRGKMKHSLTEQAIWQLCPSVMPVQSGEAKETESLIQQMGESR